MLLPVGQQMRCYGRISVLLMTGNHPFDECLIFSIGLFQFYQFFVAVFLKITFLVIDEGHTTTHTSREVTSGFTQHDYHTAGHVLAAVVTDTFHYGFYTRIADAEALAGHTTDVGIARSSAVESYVADDHIIFRHKLGLLMRVHDEFAT